MSIESHSSNEASSASSSPGTSGYASRATSYMPAASSGRSAQVTISIPAGAETAGASIAVRSSTSRELRPTSVKPRRRAQASDAVVGLLDRPHQLLVTRARAPRPRAPRAAAEPTPRPRASDDDSHLAARDALGLVPATDADRRADVVAGLGREEPHRLSRLPLPVEVPLGGVRLVDRRAHRRDPAVELVLVDLPISVTATEA